MKVSFFYILLHYFCSTVLLTLPAGLFAQHFGSKLYTINDGLPGTETDGVNQDKYGYLWISSGYGLSRYDGRQFVNFSLADGLPSLNATCVFQDSRQRLWAGTTEGMAQFKNNRFITCPACDSLNNVYVFGFLETTDKKIWVATSKGAYEFQDSLWKKISFYPGFENNMCRSIIELNGEIYVLYPEHLFCKTNKGIWIEITSLNEGSIFNTMAVYKNKILLTTKNNIYEVTNHQLTALFKNGIKEKDYFSILVDSKNRLWLAGGDYLRISAPGNFSLFADSIINRYGHAFGMAEDRSHNIWIAARGGLLKIKSVNYTIADKNNAAPLDGIFNIIPLPDNRLIFSSGTKTGLTLYNNNNYKQITPPQSLPNDNYYRDPVDAYTFDEHNGLWMTTRLWKFLYFNGKTLEDFSDAIHRKTVELTFDLAYAKSRHQLFICADSTLLYGTITHLSTFIPHNTGTPVIKPTRIHELKNGLLLLFIAGKGLFCIDKADNLISLTNKTDFINSGYSLRSTAYFSEENDNNFWMTVPGLGLYEYGFEKNKLPYLKNYFTTKDGLQSNDILSLTSDRKNRLWLVTNNGLDILQKNKSGYWDIFNYAKIDELGLTGFFYKRLVTDTAGFVWLSSPNRILRFNPTGIELYKETPRIIIEKVMLAFKETDWSKLADSLYTYYQLPYKPVLKYNQNSLGISFDAVDVSISNSSPDYSYKLLPLDTSWSLPSKIKSVSFAQLPAGKYQFEVRAKDMASGWCQPAVFIFTIASPFWEEWWFRLIVVVIASIIIISIFQSRIKKIRQDAFIQNQLKELEMKALKAQMNPHFIYNALNSIQALVADDKKAEGIHYIGSFSRLLRQVLDNSENNMISLDKELETINLYIQLESLRLNMQLQYKKDIPKEVVTEFEKIPPLILQPFIENALWHGLSRKEGDKEIKITVRLMDDWLLCDITDNGIGRVKAQEIKSHSLNLHQSKGIDITRKRLIDFNDNEIVAPIDFFDLYDADEHPCGTRVTVHIKRKKTL